MTLSERFPPLYTCSICGRAVKVEPQGLGVEPIYHYHKDCPHRNVTIHANRKVMLRGKGQLNYAQEASFKLKVSVHQLLSWLTGRSI